VGNWDEASAKAEVARLVGEFERARDEGRLSRYADSRFGEESTKKDFILPLFRALGWKTEDSREVSAEERVLRGRADYGFKIGGVTKFFVEAKGLSKNLMERENLQQVIDYSYAKGVSWGVLSNFAQTAILYSGVKDPNPFNCRFIELSAADYVSEFDRLRLLSRVAIVANELDSKAEAFGRKPKKQPIDKQLLRDLNTFRLELAKDIQRLNVEKFREATGALEETVQRLLDRLIFVRVAEDRGLEDKQLALISNGPESAATKSVRELFHRYDQNFDSKLFQLHAADEVRVDGAVLQRVLRGLHETEDGAIHYDFGAIDADVLGVMYEQYLGLALRQTAKRAKLADGAVSRKEQGIYYTPTWVVDYIVGFSVKEALKRRGATAEALRVLDPACGSGTFLLRAFDHLMRARNPTGATVQARFDPETAGPLVALRTSVLTENLYGVDLDARAVEIAQLNLMIRAAETRHRLPTLEKNVRVGNSVVRDSSVDSNAIDWAKAFPDVMKQGGFDVIVTNPPYVRIQNLEESQATYLANRFNADWNFDLYTTFVQQAWELLKDGGVAGFILPNKWVNANYGESLRSFLGDRGAILRLLDFKDYQVFDGATTYTCLLFLRKGKARTEFEFGSLTPAADPGVVKSLTDEQFSVSEVTIPRPASNPWRLVPTESRGLFERLDAIPHRLRDVAESIFVGLQTSADNVYIISVKSETGGIVEFTNGFDDGRHQIESAMVKPLLKSGDMRRWHLKWKELSLIFPYAPTPGGVKGIPASELGRSFPKARAYFSKYEDLLKGREGGKFRDNPDWHLYLYNKSLDKFPLPRLLTPNLSPFGSYSFDQGGRFAFVGGAGGGYGIVLKNRNETEYFYVLGILNSRAVEFYHHLVSSPFQGGYFSNARQYIESLPIPSADPEARSAIADVARKLTDAQMRLQGSVENTDAHRAMTEQIAEFERLLDRLTLDLFRIAPDEEKLLPPAHWISNSRG
jgi:type I restriction-modification system DNA methylase subunit